MKTVDTIKKQVTELVNIATTTKDKSEIKAAQLRYKYLYSIQLYLEQLLSDHVLFMERSPEQVLIDAKEKLNYKLLRIEENYDQWLAFQIKRHKNMKQRYYLETDRNHIVRQLETIEFILTD